LLNVNTLVLSGEATAGIAFLELLKIMNENYENKLFPNRKLNKNKLKNNFIFRYGIVNF
jgi:hypothetical protein